MPGERTRNPMIKHKRVKTLVAISLTWIALNANSEERQDVGQTVLSKAFDSAKPATSNAINYIHKSMMQSLSSGDGILGNAARADLANREQRKSQESRNTTRSVRECMKPGNVIDQDVKECANGLRERDW